VRLIEMPVRLIEMPVRLIEMPVRHPELVSGSLISKEMLNQVQYDGLIKFSITICAG